MTIEIPTAAAIIETHINNVGYVNVTYRGSLPESVRFIRLYTGGPDGAELLLFAEEGDKYPTLRICDRVDTLVRDGDVLRFTSEKEVFGTIEVKVKDPLTPPPALESYEDDASAAPAA